MDKYTVRVFYETLMLVVAVLLYAVGLIVLGFILSAIIVWPATSQPIQGQTCEYGAFGCNHMENHQKYKDWNARPIFRDGKPTKDGNCCNGQDCRPVRAAKDENDNWRVFIPELKDTTIEPIVIQGWLLVEKDKVDVADRFGDGRSHICTSPFGAFTSPLPKVYCFSPAQPKT